MTTRYGHLRYDEAMRGKQIPITQFKAQCLRLFGSSLQIGPTLGDHQTRKPLAQVTWVVTERRSLMGGMRG